MRTTIDLPDDILRRAKMAAVERGSSLRQLVIDALRQELETPPRTLRRRMTSPPIKLAADSPLRSLNPQEIKRLDADAQELADESRASAVHR
jgi:hypothetical protein